MPTEAKNRTFWNRGWAAILGIGALATVIIAVFGVFNLFKDPADQATMTVTLGEPMTLQAYTAMKKAEDDSEEPVPGTGAPQSETGLIKVILLGEFSPALGVGSASGPQDAIEGSALGPAGPVLPDPDPVAPNPADPDPVAPNPADPDPVAPDPADPDPVAPNPADPDPVAPNPADPDPVAPSEPTEPSGTGPELPGAPVTHPLSADYGIAPGEMPWTFAPASRPEAVDPDDPNRPELQPEEVEERLAKMLSLVDTTQGDGVLNLLGHIVSVNFTLDGYANVPIVLTSTISGTPVPGEWAASEVEYDITATTEHDTGTVDIWVPDLKAPGPYVVTAKLFRAEGHVPITSGKVQVPNAQ